MCTQRISPPLAPSPRHELQLELRDEAFDGQHGPTRRFACAPRRAPDAGSRRSRRTARCRRSAAARTGPRGRPGRPRGRSARGDRARRRGSREAASSDSSSLKDSLVSLSLTSSIAKKKPSPAHVADDRESCRVSSAARNSPSFAWTWPHRSSRSKMSRLAIAAAAATGCPAKVEPWAKDALPSENGSNTLSEAIIAPIGDVGGGERLRGGDDVRLVAVALAAEVVTEAAPGADHLVGDQQHVVAVADLAHPLEVAVLRRDAAARVLERLEDHGGDGLGPLEHDLLLDLVGGPERVAVLGPAIAVGVGDVARRPASAARTAVRSGGMPVAESAPIVVPW